MAGSGRADGAAPAPPAPPSEGAGVVVDELVGGLGAVTDFAFLPDGGLVILEKEAKDATDFAVSA